MNSSTIATSPNSSLAMLSAVAPIFGVGNGFRSDSSVSSYLYSTINTPTLKLLAMGVTVAMEVVWLEV